MNWLLIAGMACITFMNRYAFFTTLVQYQPNAKFKRFLSYSSLAVLTAIWTPIVFGIDTNSGLQIAGWDYLLATLLAIGFTAMRLPSLFTVLVSTAVFFILRAVI